MTKKQGIKENAKTNLILLLFNPVIQQMWQFKEQTFMSNNQRS